MKNHDFFGFSQVGPREALQVSRVRNAVGQMLRKVLVHFGVDVQSARSVAGKCLELASYEGDLHEYERRTHRFLQTMGVIRLIPVKLAGRSTVIHDQIKGHLVGGSVLDLGCGDGQVGSRLAREGRPVFLADVYRHSAVDQSDLPFTVIQQGEVVPFKKIFLTTRYF